LLHPGSFATINGLVPTVVRNRWILSCGHRFLSLFLCLGFELRNQCVSRNIIDRARGAGHIEPTLLQQREQIFILDPDLLGKLMNADAHLWGSA